MEPIESFDVASFTHPFIMFPDEFLNPLFLKLIILGVREEEG
jgi:hypothetical protein